MKEPVIGVTTSYEDAAHQEKEYCNHFYPDRILACGGAVRFLYFGTPLSEIPSILDELDGVLIIGGRDVEPCLYGAERLPECGDASMTKDRFEIELIRETVRREMPLLGICRGIQVINVALGGTLIQDLPSQVGTLHQQPGGNRYWHDVDIVPGTMLSELFGAERIATNSYHHQAVDKLGEGLRISARNTRDGVIEAIEGTGRGFLLSPQWHPERTFDTDRYSPLFFRTLVAKAAQYRDERG